MLQSLAEPLKKRITGTYENKTVQLTEILPSIRSSKVIVTFLDSIEVNPMSRFITLGMFSGKNQSTAEDFTITQDD